MFMGDEHSVVFCNPWKGHSKAGRDDGTHLWRISNVRRALYLLTTHTGPACSASGSQGGLPIRSRLAALPLSQGSLCKKGEVPCLLGLCEEPACSHFCSLETTDSQQALPGTTVPSFHPPHCPISRQRCHSPLTMEDTDTQKRTTCPRPRTRVDLRCA